MIKRIMSLLILLGILIVMCVLFSEITRVNPAITIVVLMATIGIVLSGIAIYFDTKGDEK